jgi:hypothetical protein
MQYRVQEERIRAREIAEARHISSLRNEVAHRVSLWKEFFGEGLKRGKSVATDGAPGAKRTHRPRETGTG